MTQQRKVVLSFKEGADDTTEELVKRGALDRIAKPFTASIDDIPSWFEKFQVGSIELWITGGVESGGITELFVSIKGEGGMKVVLKPK